MSTLLEVRGLTRRFGALTAVSDSTFTVGEREVVSIIGPNGSGKTTTINLISGELRPDAGRILFAGRDIAGATPDEVAAAGLKRTFQNGRVFGNSTVEANLLVGQTPLLRAAAPLRGLRRVPVLRWVALVAELGKALVRTPAMRAEERELDERVGRQLARFGERLTPRRHHNAATLSYANRRRTEIARALASGPQVLLLDEPTAGMNISETNEVMHQLLELKAQGQAMLLVEHKLDLVMTVSDRVIVMDNGAIIAEGTPAQVQRDPRVIEAYLGTRRHRAHAAEMAAEGAAAAHATEVDAPDVRDTEVSERAVREREVPKSEVRGGDVPPLLDVRSVDVHYGQFHALQSVSYSIQPGEIVSLLGGNASGKSTSMKTILRLVEPSAGDIDFDGRSTLKESTADVVRRGIASVPEARRVFPEMTIEENLLVGAFTRRERSAALRTDLQAQYDLFPRLAERRTQQAGTLSGGEQQMLAFARALMSRPKLICMDEPTMGLAPIVVEQVLDTIERINRELGVAVFMVEQNAELALSIAHRGYVLTNGAVRLSGTAPELLANPAIREAYLGQTAEAA